MQIIILPESTHATPVKQLATINNGIIVAKYLTTSKSLLYA